MVVPPSMVLRSVFDGSSMLARSSFDRSSIILRSRSVPDARKNDGGTKVDMTLCASTGSERESTATSAQIKRTIRDKKQGQLVDFCDEIDFVFGIFLIFAKHNP